MAYELFTIIMDNTYIMEKISERGTKVLRPYRYSNFFFRCLRKVVTKFHLKTPILYNKKICDINTDNIIVFDSLISKEFLEWISSYHKNRRIIFYYWNPVVLSLAISQVPSNIECWSYSPSDCNNFHIKFNQQFYFKNIYLKKRKTQYDVYFCGSDKGRLGNILNLQNIFNRQGLLTRVRIIPTRWFQRWKNPRYEKYIPYEKIIDEISLSNAILDYNIEANGGYTLRVMEAIFLGKKLISNNKNLNNSDYRENTFLIGVDKIEDVNNFIEKPLVTIPDIKEKYDFKQWLERFLR